MHVISMDRFIQSHYEKLKELCEHDPILMQVVIILCPSSELGILFKKITPYFSVSWLAYIAAQANKGLLSGDVRKFVHFGV